MLRGILPMTVVPAAETVDKNRLAFLDWLASDAKDRHDGYALYRDYYDGEQGTMLTERQRRFLQVRNGQEFNVNYCEIPVDVLAERLNVVGFDAGDQAQAIWEWWQKGRMDAVQDDTHRAAIRDGDAYVIVGWDDEAGRPEFHFEPAFDGTEGVEIHYADERRKPSFASKRWRVSQGPGAGNVRRLNLYYPDRIEKYVSNQATFEGAWQPYHDEDDSEWPLPWVAKDGSPLGLPVVHFANAAGGYNYGRSELKKIIPIQNALNKAIIDLIAAADTTAFRILYMLGDDPGDLEITPGSWVYSNRPPSGENGVAIGAIDGQDLTPLIRLKDSFAVEIARVSRTPLSYFQVSGERPAEGTLKQEESGLVAKAKNRVVTFGNAWEDAMTLARRLWNTFGPGPEMSEEQVVEARWADIQTRNDKEFLEGLALKREKLGITREQAWREMNYDEDTIDTMTAETEANMASVVAHVAGAVNSGAQGG